MKKNLKKVISLVLCLAMAFVICGSALAFETAPANIQTEGAYTVQEYDGSLFYTYMDDCITYTSQITDGSILQFSYMNTDQQDVVYSSDAFYITDFLDDIGIPTNDQSEIIESNELINDAVRNNIGLFMNLEEIYIDLYSAPPPAAPTTTINDELIRVFGSDYSGVNRGGAAKSYNGISYTVYCNENQYTLQLDTKHFTYWAGTAASVIITALSTFWGATVNWLWFLSAAGSAIDIVNNIQVIANAISGTLYAYQSVRTRQVTVSGYATVVYHASWERKVNFFYNALGDYFDLDTVYNNQHWDYGNISQLMDTGFTNYINYHL